ncbi:MAG: right-handed parallel beta-helix repeat-containing protein [Candidatus Cloacimonadales bacterium]|nr:right-handed parallel beta-helix repeat-containing protein [Candidatus Cloacimonadales bacterium]
MIGIDVYGNQSGTWTLANSPYNVIDDVTVITGTTLTIEAGVQVQFNLNKKITINGTLLALGDEGENQIVFSSSQDWSGIKFIGSTSSEMIYCDISGSNYGGITISNSSNIDITYCYIHDNAADTGAGINIENGSSYVTIQNCTITFNESTNNISLGGGGIACSSGEYLTEHITIEGCNISGNNSEKNGGGIFLNGSSYTEINSNDIIDNEAEHGGGIYVAGGAENNISSNYIYDNHAGTSWNYGGGVYLKTACNITGNEISYNTAGRNGGGIYATFWSVNRDFSDNIIHHNEADHEGGGLYVIGSPSIINCEFFFNTSLYNKGGGIYVASGSNIEIIECYIHDNFALNNAGGGIYAYISTPYIFRTTICYNSANVGGGIVIDTENDITSPIVPESSLIDHCVIYGNDAGSICGGLLVYCYEDYYSVAVCSNSIFFSNFVLEEPLGVDLTVGALTNQNANSVVKYNCIGPNGFEIGDPDYVIVENNIFENPLFVNPSVSNFYLTLPSPCIDAGDPMYSGTPDPDDTITDIGRYYFEHDYDIHILNKGYNWESFPKLDRDETINESADIVTVLNHNISPFNFTYLAMETNDLDNDPELTWNVTTGWDPYPYEVRSSWLCKIMATPEEERVLKVGSVDDERLPADFVLNQGYEDERFPLVEAEYHWIGYWPQESRNIQDALAYYWYDIEKVKAEDWYYDKCINNRGGDPQPVSWSTTGKTMEYGKGYMIWFKEGTEPLTTFQWNLYGEVEEPIKKAESESFTYTEFPDYEVIDVVDIPENVVEIGVFQEEICVGAVVVTDSCEQILVYSENANREPIPFNFEIVTNNRELNLPVNNYKVYNKNSGEFETGYVVSGQQESSIIMFGDIGEPQNETPEINKVQLNNNYPNPFNPETNISFSIPLDQKITLTIYNLKGQKVRELVSGQFASGQHSVVWEGKDDNGKQVGSGLYFYKLKTDDKEISKKMLLLK